jgi:small subunit ribosomal protein S3
MGQKVNPVGLRLGITRNWASRWFADRTNYRTYLHEDLALRKFIKGRMYQAGISTIDIERTTQRVIINIHSAKPGMIIGKRGVEIEQLRNELQARTGRQVFVNIHEVRVPEVDAQLVSENIAAQLQKRVSYRRIVKKAALLSMRGGAKGIKTQLSGRLAGAEIARYHRDVLGKVPLHTLRAEIDYGHATSFTTHGTIGVKVWIYKGDALFSGRAASARAEAGSPVGGRTVRPAGPVAPAVAPAVVPAVPKPGVVS